jgi:hypothetical protein
MFVDMSPLPSGFAPLGAKSGDGTIPDAGKGDCAPTELKSKERTGGYKHPAPPGRSDR